MIALAAWPVAAPETIPAPAPTDSLALLAAAPEAINPALAAAWVLRRAENAAGGPLPLEDLLNLAPRLALARDAGGDEVERGVAALKTLRAAHAVPSPTVPEGF